MAQRTSITDRIDYENRDGVGIWIIDDLQETLQSGELAEAEDHFRETVTGTSMSGVVIVLENTELDGETMDHVNEKWTELGEVTGIDRTAYVSDGIERLTVANKNEAQGMEATGVASLDRAVEWAAGDTDIV
ncbi:hypothetical protein GJ629_12085 [Halapricum sp. CBA1109]|uniref:hypothetical protein n=1 Tax=Halapricum sp. CBA1109 TaxID=2668068 RepID=UPI0012FB1D10|nr:hypothetical protein [Halapricum sp. CBA1109]MUV90549.1 hypothetical protein [Halapricum sp. CBA1109]